MTIEGWFQQDDPALIAFDDFHAEFGSEDHLFVVYKPKDGNVFSAKSLEIVKKISDDITDKISKLKEGEESPLRHIVKVKSLINAPVLSADGDVLISRHLVGSTIPTTQGGLDSIRMTAESQKSFPLFYFSKDMTYGGILIETDFGAIPVDSELPAANKLVSDSDLTMDNAKSGTAIEETKGRIKFKSTDLKDYFAVMVEINKILKKPEYTSHLEYYPVGRTATSEADLANLQEMGSLYLAGVLIMMVLLWFLFRSPSPILWSMSIVIITSIWTLGFAGWLGLPLTGFLILTLMLLLTVGMADSVHIMSGYLFFRNEEHDHKTALRVVYKKTGIACLLTAVTTIVGIVALNITPIVPIQNFAIMSAGGVALAYLLTMFLLPLLLDLWPPVKVEKVQSNRIKIFIGKVVPNFSRFLQKKLDKIPPFVQGRPITILLPFLVFFIICVYGASKIKVDTNSLSAYPKNSKVVNDFKVVDKNMMGTQNWEILLDLGKEDAFKDPMVLQVMDHLQQKIQKSSDLVVRTSSLVDVVKTAYQALNEGKKEMYVIPDDQEVLSQTLFMFDNANPEDRRKMVSDDYRKAHISVFLHNTGSYEYSEVFKYMQKDIEDAINTIKQKYPDAKITRTGMLALIMEAGDYIVYSEIQAFVFALFIISIILLIVFGSLKAGVIALLPNLIPSMLAFGLMGLLNIPLDFFTMMLAPIIIGIAIDDTVHFIGQYRAEVIVDGNIKRALAHTMKETGQAVIFTGLILGLGFGVLAFASGAGTSTVGTFGFLAVFAGTLNDLILLPTLILIFKLDFQKKDKKKVSQQ
ncbi:MAG: MMPL family transporter [Bacteroidales bacterium]|nr:MMPL family transporter [Bacteroidales bacterium]